MYLLKSVRMSQSVPSNYKEIAGVELKNRMGGNCQWMALVFANSNYFS